MKLNRRDFLKVCGAGAVMLGVGAKMAPPSLDTGARNVPQPPRNVRGILIDTTKCVGCQRCQVACQQNKSLPADTNTRILCNTSPSVVQMKNVSTDPAKAIMKPVKRQCMNCNNPACVAACTVGALQKRPDGPVVYDSNRCIGCRYCMYACPFGVPTFEWEKQFSLIVKCDGCAARLDQGKPPACVEACPAAALTFGDRTELLTIANQRIYGAKSTYVNHVYGENEIGGTSMMYLSNVPFEQLGFPTLPNEAPAEINATIMHSTPTIAASMIMALSGIYMLIKTRDRLEPQAVENENGNGGH
jgi:formate dehydrogenase iron-sulfur subunit